jgi:hypothetical protein
MVMLGHEILVQSRPAECKYPEGCAFIEKVPHCSAVSALDAAVKNFQDDEQRQLTAVQEIVIKNKDFKRCPLLWRRVAELLKPHDDRTSCTSLS